MIGHDHLGGLLSLLASFSVKGCQRKERDANRRPS
jgi:hypothetical protein